MNRTYLRMLLLSNIIFKRNLLLYIQSQATKNSLRRRNPQIPNVKFDLDLIDPAKCVHDFRFDHAQLRELVDLLRFPDYFILESRHKVSSLEALCIWCRRMVYPNRLNDLMLTFGKEKSYLSRVFKEITM